MRGRSDQHIGRPPAAALQEARCFQNWPHLGSVAIIVEKVPNPVMEDNMIITSHATQGMASLAGRWLPAEAARPSSTHIDSQPATYESKEIGTGQCSVKCV